MNSLAVLLIGYSVFAAVALALTRFRREDLAGQALCRVAGLVLLGTLAALQLAHFAWLQFDLPWVETLPYRMSLFAVAPAFYLFSRPILDPGAAPQPGFVLGAHLLPVALAPLLPAAQGQAAAFVVGAGYLAWLGVALFRVRAERTAFRREVALLGMVFAIAVAASVLGLMQSTLPAKLYHGLYAMAIGMAFLLVQVALDRRPNLATEVCEAVQTAYANSSLGSVDCEAVLARLDRLMADEHVYTDADLSLPTLADRLALSAHQLSELINTRLGKGFSRYLREQRVAAAKAMLCDEPTASVLSVGLCVGFSAQSNFYAAFREIEGMTPGQYRKLHVTRPS